MGPKILRGSKQEEPGLEDAFEQGHDVVGLALAQEEVLDLDDLVVGLEAARRRHGG